MALANDDLKELKEHRKGEETRDGEIGLLASSTMMDDDNQSYPNRLWVLEWLQQFMAKRPRTGKGHRE